MTKTSLTALILSILPLLPTEQVQVDQRPTKNQPTLRSRAGAYFGDVFDKDKREERYKAYTESKGVAAGLQDKILAEIEQMGFTGPLKQKVAKNIVADLPQEAGTYEDMLLSSYQAYDEPNGRLDNIYKKLRPNLDAKFKLYENCMKKAKRRKEEVANLGFSRPKEFIQTWFDPTTSRDVEEMAFLMASGEQSPARLIGATFVNFFEHLLISPLKGLRSLADRSYRKEVASKGIRRTASRALLGGANPSSGALSAVMGIISTLLSGSGFTALKFLSSGNAAVPFLAAASPILAVFAAGLGCFWAGYQFATWLGLPKSWRYGLGGLFAFIAVVLGLLTWRWVNKKQSKKRERDDD